MNKFKCNSIYFKFGKFGEDSIECLGNFDCQIDKSIMTDVHEKYLTVAGEMNNFTAFNKVYDGNIIDEILYPIQGTRELIAVEGSEFKASGYLVEYSQQEESFKYFHYSPTTIRTEQINPKTQIKIGFRAKFKLVALAVKSLGLNYSFEYDKMHCDGFMNKLMQAMNDFGHERTILNNSIVRELEALKLLIERLNCEDDLTDDFRRALDKPSKLSGDQWMQFAESLSTNIDPLLKQAIQRYSSARLKSEKFLRSVVQSIISDQ